AGSWGAWALETVLAYGPWALALVMMLCSAGAPLPASVLVVAAGAFARQGLVPPVWTFAAALLGIVAGDNIAYAVGRLGGEWTEQRFGRSLKWQEALERFRQRGATTVFLTRWLFTAIGSVVAMIAGISRFGWGRFLLLGGAGKLLWVLIYWSIGWTLGSQWQVGAAFLTANSGLILAVSLLVVALVVGVRALRARRRQPLAALPDPASASDPS
ncbi:MAG: DedA family protein, partial [Caldilineaceae bacterium]